jgi:hypothetical protein
MGRGGRVGLVPAVDEDIALINEDIASINEDIASINEGPINDVTCVLDFPEKSLHFGCTHEEPGGESCAVTFTAGLPGGIQLTNLPDPQSMHEAMAAPDADGWREAMDREMENLCSHNVYELVPRTPGMCTLRLGWVLHRKFKNGTFDKNKARIVACGNHQRPRIDYGESFVPVMRLESLHTLLALAAHRDLEIVQFNITSAYLHGTLKEEVYVEQPDGYVSGDRMGWVWRLRKGLYGLVQAGRTWNEELDAHMKHLGYSAAVKDMAVYVKGSWGTGGFVAGGFWVDDFIGIGSGEGLGELAGSVDRRYGITGLGEVKWLLGMLVECDRASRTIYISQSAFIDSALARFQLTNTHPVMTPLVHGARLSLNDCPGSDEEKLEMAGRPYRELVGVLSWLTLGTRPNITFAASTLARYNSNPGRTHWEAAKRVLRYLKGTRGWRLRLGGEELEVAAFMDTNWGGNRNDRRSVGAYIVKLGGGATSCKSKKQGCVALSLTEAEYVALCQAAKESVWTVEFLRDLGVPIPGAMVVNVNNQGAVALAKNPVFHDCSKHIDIQYHYTREVFKAGAIGLAYLLTKEMLTDLLTKPLPRGQHEFLVHGIGLF